MEAIKTAINLLKAVHATMDGISISGIENQDKFLGCANAIQTTVKALDACVREMELDSNKNENNVEEVNG